MSFWVRDDGEPIRAVLRVRTPAVILGGSAEVRRVFIPESTSVSKVVHDHVLMRNKALMKDSLEGECPSPNGETAHLF